MDKVNTEDKRVRKDVANAILQEGVDFHIDYNNPNILRRKGLLPKSKKYVLKPLVMGTLIRISEIMVDMEFTEKVTNEKFTEQGIQMMAEHTEKLIEIIALAIKNTEDKPSWQLKRLIRKNATVTDLLSLITVVVSQMDVGNFMKSIISIKGVSLLEKEEIIASGQPLEE